MSTDTGPGVFRAQLATSRPLDTSAVVKAVYVSDVGEGDFLYAFGEGSSEGSSVTLDFFTEAPPEEATFGGRLGVGVVTLFEQAPPDGVIAGATFDASLGYSFRHAVIWRPEDMGDIEAGWWDAFEPGYSCAVCVEGDGVFDAWEPVDCSEAVVQMTEDQEGVEFCNWT